MTAIQHDPTPLAVDPHGTIRVGGTRVTLDTVVTAFKLGSSAEQIVESYDVLRLADVYGVISYYLRHTSEVELYLAQQQRECDEIRRTIEAQSDQSGIRERLMARREQAEASHGATPRG